MKKRKHIWSAMTVLLTVVCCIAVLISSLAEGQIPYADVEDRKSVV